MADDVDIAQEYEELSMKHNLANARKMHLKPNGYCYNCREEVSGCFCDKDCEDDWRKMYFKQYGRYPW